MKGTLFSADFIQDSDAKLRLLEFNTDTGFILNTVSSAYISKFELYSSCSSSLFSITILFDWKYLLLFFDELNNFYCQFS